MDERTNLLAGDLENLLEMDSETNEKSENKMFPTETNIRDKNSSNEKKIDQKKLHPIDRNSQTISRKSSYVPVTSLLIGGPFTTIFISFLHLFCALMVALQVYARQDNDKMLYIMYALVFMITGVVTFLAGIRKSKLEGVRLLCVARLLLHLLSGVCGFYLSGAKHINDFEIYDKDLIGHLEMCLACLGVVLASKATCCKEELEQRRENEKLNNALKEAFEEKFTPMKKNIDEHVSVHVI